MALAGARQSAGKVPKQVNSKLAYDRWINYAPMPLRICGIHSNIAPISEGMQLRSCAPHTPLFIRDLSLDELGKSVSDSSQAEIDSRGDRIRHPFLHPVSSVHEAHGPLAMAVLTYNAHSNTCRHQDRW